MIKDFTRQDLEALQPAHRTLVGIDSDGCVFDSMEVKQRTFFHPMIVRAWGLQAIEAQVRRAAEFFNLYSQFRGENRFVALLRTFKALPELPGVRAARVELPATTALERYVTSGVPLGNPSLAEETRRSGDPELARILEWSLAVNRAIDQEMQAIPPFPAARKSLACIADSSDAIVVSQTPAEALIKEWRLHALDRFVRVIAGQELGKKSEHLQLAARGRYPPQRVLMIGDAPGDRKAARETGACFYPIEPGNEDESWLRFHDEAYPRFLAGTYDAAYQRVLIEAFDARLPAEAPWLTPA